MQQTGPRYDTEREMKIKGANRKTARITAALFMAAVLSSGSLAMAQTAQDQRLTAPDDWRFQDSFGFSVDLTQEWMAVGERGDGGPPPDENKPFGSAHLFRRSGTGWEHVQELRPADVDHSAFFGASVAFADATTLFVGASYYNKLNGTNSGAVWVYEYDGTTWRQVQRIDPPMLTNNHQWFGAALDADGGLVLVASGVQHTDDPNHWGIGYLYEKTVSGWTLAHELVPASMDHGVGIWSVSLDGDTAVLGTPVDYGQAWVFERRGNGTWSETQEFFDPNQVQNDSFGVSVAVSGNLLVIGESFRISGFSAHIGEAWVYERSSPGATWKLKQVLTASNGGIFNFFGDQFGETVMIHDGEIYVSAPAIPDVGNAYRFHEEPGGTWTEVERFEPVDEIVAGFDAFGSALAMAMVDGTLVVGGPGAWAGGVNDGARAGAAYVFRRPLGTVFCDPANPNSTGQGASLDVLGSPRADLGALSLVATDLPPGRFTLFLASRTEGFVPNPGGSQGNLCLGGPVARFTKQVTVADSGGRAEIAVDTSSIPVTPPAQILAGESWSFQAWYRDANPTGTSNFTSAVTLVFQ